MLQASSYTQRNIHGCISCCIPILLTISISLFCNNNNNSSNNKDGITFIFQVETIRVVLKKELDLPIIEISDQDAKLDGSDVLFTGK